MPTRILDINLKTKIMIELPKKITDDLFIESVKLNNVTGEAEDEQSLTLTVNSDSHLGVNFEVYLSGYNNDFEIIEDECYINISNVTIEDNDEELVDFLSVLLSQHLGELESFANEYYKCLVASHLIKLHSFEVESENSRELTEPIVYSIMSCFKIISGKVTTEIIAATKEEAISIYVDISNNSTLASKNRFLEKLTDSNYTCEYSHDVIVCNNPDYDAKVLSNQKYGDINTTK